MKNYIFKIVNLETQNISKITKTFESEKDLYDFVNKELAARKALTNCDHAVIF